MWNGFEVWACPLFSSPPRLLTLLTLLTEGYVACPLLFSFVSPPLSLSLCSLSPPLVLFIPWLCDDLLTFGQLLLSSLVLHLLFLLSSSPPLHLSSLDQPVVASIHVLTRAGLWAHSSEWFTADHFLEVIKAQHHYNEQTLPHTPTSLIESQQGTRDQRTNCAS